MNIELKNIKHFPSMSQETEAYNASLYVDGEKIGTVSNNGCGGCDCFTGDHQKFIKANEYCKTLPPVPYENFELDNDLELYCSIFLQRHIARKEMKSKFKKSTIFHDENDLYITNDAPDQVLKKYPSAIILNTLPTEEALELWMN